MAGCATSANYTSKGAYLGAMHEVELDMEALGFHPVATGHETVNEGYVLNDEWKNDWVTYDTRQFADSLGYTAAYTVAYRACEDGMRIISVTGCEVSHPDDYALVCGDDGVVQRMNNVPVDVKGSVKAGPSALYLLGISIPIVILLLLLS